MGNNWGHFHGLFKQVTTSCCGWAVGMSSPSNFRVAIGHPDIQLIWSDSGSPKELASWRCTTEHVLDASTACKTSMANASECHSKPGSVRLVSTNPDFSRYFGAGVPQRQMGRKTLQACVFHPHPLRVSFCGKLFRCCFCFCWEFGPSYPPSNDIIISQHAAGIVREMGKAVTTILTRKTLISGVLLINSSGITLCGMITLKCLITNLYVMMHFNYFGLVH